jgi:hypothetical protein
MKARLRIQAHLRPSSLVGHDRNKLDGSFLWIVCGHFLQQIVSLTTIFHRRFLVPQSNLSSPFQAAHGHPPMVN